MSVLQVPENNPVYADMGRGRWCEEGIVALVQISLRYKASKGLLYPDFQGVLMHSVLQP